MSVLDRVVNSIAAAVNARVKFGADGVGPIDSKWFGGGRPLVSWASRAWADPAFDTDVTASAVAYRCIESIASNGSSLPLALRDPSGEPVEHPFVALWNKAPNPHLSARVMGQGLWWRLQTRGEWFAYLDRGQTGTGDVGGIYPLLDAAVEVVVSGRQRDPWDNEVVGYAVERNERKVTLLPGEVLWVRYPDPDDPLGVISPLAAALGALDLDQAARLFQRGTLANADTPAGVLYLGDVDPDEHAKVSANLAARHAGAANAGRTLLLSGPVPSKYERFGLTAAEVGYLDTRVRNAEEVMLAFGVPRDYLMGGATYENRTASRATLWSDKIAPDADLIASEIDHQVFPDVALEAFFDLSGVDALRESQDAVVSRTTSLVTSDLVLLDEGRAAMGLDPLPAGQGQQTLSAYRAGLAILPAPAARAVLEALPIEGQVIHTRARDPLAIGAVRRTMKPLVADITAAADVMLADQERLVRRNAERLFSGSRSAERTLDRLSRAPSVADLTRSLTGALTAGCASVAADRLAAPVGRAWATGDETYCDVLDVGTEPEATELAAQARVGVVASETTATLTALLERHLTAAAADAAEAWDRKAPRLPDWMLTALAEVFELNRSDTIGVTEAFGGFNNAGFRSAVRANAFTKTWMTMRDSKVRETHADQDGMDLDVNSVFPNGCSYPHDPGGFAAEVINCRCYLLFSHERYEP